MCVGEPTTDWDGVLWVEDVGSWRVIDDDGFFEIASDLRKVLLVVRIMKSTYSEQTYLDIVSLMVVATFTEKSVMNDTMNVQLIEERVTVLENVSYASTSTAVRNIPSILKQ